MPRIIFVTGGSGFIGGEVCRVCVAEGDKVLALCRSQASSRKVEALGAVPIEGDLLESGDWQRHARAAECVVHLAQPSVFGGRISGKRARAFERGCARMDGNLWDHLDPLQVKRIVYVSGTCYYGNLGPALCDETATPQPFSIGRYIVSIMDRVDALTRERWPIVTAFPGCVYGPGSWYEEYFLRPISQGKRVLAFTGHCPSISPIHVQDCARALVHLLDHGPVGERYFLVDDQPVPWSRLRELTASALGVSPKSLTVPRRLLALLMGRIAAEGFIEMEAVLSNAKLKRTGFRFNHPSIDTGIPSVVAQIRNRNVGRT